MPTSNLPATERVITGPRATVVARQEVREVGVTGDLGSGPVASYAWIDIVSVALAGTGDLQAEITPRGVFLASGRALDHAAFDEAYQAVTD